MPTLRGHPGHRGRCGHRRPSGMGPPGGRSRPHESASRRASVTRATANASNGSDLPRSGPRDVHRTNSKQPPLVDFNVRYPNLEANLVDGHCGECLLVSVDSDHHRPRPPRRIPIPRQRARLNRERSRSYQVTPTKAWTGRTSEVSPNPVDGFGCSGGVP